MWIYGWHERGGEWVFEQAGVDGWICETVAIGHNPADLAGADFSGLARHEVICRLNNGYNPDGTLPVISEYKNFATRCGNFVRSTLGCSRYIIGNEPNMSIERPTGHVIEAADYALCFLMCRDAIKAAQPDAQVIPAAVAPWNIETGDWIEYFDKVYRLIGEVDGVCLHTYTHGYNPALVTSEQKMDPPYTDRRYHFRAYLDFLSVLSDDSIPVYITETNGNDAWPTVNSGWVQEAYKEIDRYNQGHGGRIKCLCLYRWPKYDKYGIEGNAGAIDDMRAAIAMDYKTEDGDMATWQRRYADGFEQGFVWQDGISELEVPNGWRAVWQDDPRDGILDRPEYKPKLIGLGHPEVIEGEASAGIFSSHSTLDGSLVRAYAVDPGKQYFARVKVSNLSGDPNDVNAQGAVNSVLMIVSYTTDPIARPVDVLAASEWYGQDRSDWEQGNIASIETPHFTPGAGQVLVYLRTTTRWARPSATHFDAFELWEFDDGGGVDPPEPGDGVQAELLAQIDKVQAELDVLRGIVEGLASRAIACLPLGAL